MIPYDRAAAVRYAHHWAYSRNPRYYNYDGIGGDCTNFASQCLYAGVGVMNFTPTFGWYYKDANDKAPAWTGVTYFYDFMTQNRERTGPFGVETNISNIQPGDFVQLNFKNGKSDTFDHTPIVVERGEAASLENVLVAAHSDDADFRPLSTYIFQDIRFIHILGAFVDQAHS